MVIGFALPKRSACPPEQTVCLHTGVTFPTLQNRAERVARARMNDRMNVIGHDHPGMEVITLTVKKLQGVRHKPGNFRTVQPAIPVSGVQVGVHALRVPIEQRDLFVPCERAIVCPCLGQNGLALASKLQQKLARQCSRESEGDKIAGALALQVRQRAARMQPRQ